MNWLKRGTLLICAMVLAATAGCDDDEGFTFSEDLATSGQACDPAPHSAALAPGLSAQPLTVTHLPNAPLLVPALVPANANTTAAQKKRLRPAAYRITKSTTTQSQSSGQCRRF